MPCYPALALLLGSAMAAGGNWIRYGTRALCGIFVLRGGAVLTLYCAVVESTRRRAIFPRHSARIPALTSFRSATWRISPSLRSLICGCRCFWPRWRSCSEPLGTFRARGQRAFLAMALMSILFFQAARIAMAAFDPLSFFAPARRCSAPCARGKAHCGSSLLHVLLGLLLHEPHGTAAQWPFQQSGLRFLCAGRAECVH